MKISRVESAPVSPSRFSTKPRIGETREKTKASGGISWQTKAVLLLVAGVLVGTNFGLARLTVKPPSIATPRGDVAQQSQSVAEPAAFGVGAFAPALDLRISSPVQISGRSAHLGYVRRYFDDSSATPIVVGILSTSPKCDCRALVHTLNAVQSKAANAYQVFAVDSSRIGSVAERTTLDEQLAFDAGLTVAIGIDPHPPLPPADVASVWADGVVPSILVIDHDFRVRYIARGAAVSDLAQLKAAVRESVGHYRRERGIPPKIVL